MFRKLPLFYFLLWNTVFSPVHLWVAKYSCISVWNDWESISRWHYSAASPRWKCSQAAGHPPNWLSSSQRHLSSKEPRGKCSERKKEKDHNRFSTCRWMHAMSNSRCQTNVLFAMNVYGEWRGWYGRGILDCDWHRPRCSADAAQEKRNFSNNPWVNWDQL